MAIHFCPVHGCFPIAQGEVSSCNRYCEPGNLKCVLSSLNIKKLLAYSSRPGTGHFLTMLVFIFPYMAFFSVINGFSVAYDFFSEIDGGR